MNSHLNNFKNQMLNNNNSLRTVDAYYNDLIEFFNWIKKDDIKNITLSDLNNFNTYLREKGNAPSSRSQKISAIKKFYSYLVSISTIRSEDNISKLLENPKLRKKEAEYLTFEEAQKLVNVISGENSVRNRSIIMLFLDTGLRLSELTGINVSDIKDNTIKVLGKEDKERTVFLNSDTLRCLQNWLSTRPNCDMDALFISERNNRLSNKSCENMIKKYYKKAALNYTKTHTLRHTAATLMLQNEVDSSVIANMLGHADMRTVSRYVHIINEQRQRAADSIKIRA